MIEPMAKRHVDQVANLHSLYIPSLLADLGRRACRAFYRHAVASPNCLGFVDTEAGLVRGFALGALDNSILFRSWSLRLAVLRGLARRPRLARRILFHLRGGPAAPAPEILYEAVDPHWRRQGIATALDRALGEALRERGATRCEIRIDHDNRANLERHLKLGARIVGEFKEDGAPRYLLDSSLKMR